MEVNRLGHLTAMARGTSSVILWNYPEDMQRTLLSKEARHSSHHGDHNHHHSRTAHHPNDRHYGGRSASHHHHQIQSRDSPYNHLVGTFDEVEPTDQTKEGGATGNEPGSSSTEQDVNLPQKPIGMLKTLYSSSKNVGTEQIKAEAAPVDSNDTTAIVSGMLTVLTILCIVMCLLKVNRRKKNEKHSDKALLDVFKYLVDFDLEDVDIKASPSGGFLVGYQNGLAEGANNKSEDMTAGTVGNSSELALQESGSEPQISLSENI